MKYFHFAILGIALVFFFVVFGAMLGVVIGALIMRALIKKELSLKELWRLVPAPRRRCDPLYRQSKALPTWGSA